jgi:cholesterol transport system auxiliary component
LAGLCALALCGCALPDKPMRPSTYDFGAGTATGDPAQNTRLPTVVLSDVEVGAALDSTAVWYRLGYANAQQLQAYAHARWSMPPAQLLQQRLRERLGEQATVLKGAQAMPTQAKAPAPWLLRVELEEFSQFFDSPQHSVGLLRLRATVTQDKLAGAPLLAQRSFFVQRPAPQADAAGGVRALTAASDAAIDELLLWMTQLRP